MDDSKAIKVLTLVALRFGVIAFLFSFFYELIGDSDPNSPFWEDILSVGGLVAVVAASVILLVLDKRHFEVFGFFLVFVISLYRVLAILFEFGFRHTISIHLLLIILSFYLLSKPFRTKHRQGVGFLE